jgi:hypothetical protein
VTGQVVDSTSGISVGSGFIVLLDREGMEVARALSAGDGRFTLRAPTTGRYRLRSERIGYRAQETTWLELPTDTTINVTVRIEAFPVVLAAVEVVGDERCSVHPERAAQTAVLWEEIRKALAATAWDSTQELLHYRKYSYERDLAEHRTLVTREDGRTVEGLARQPYSSLPAHVLARDGYVVPREGGLWYNLPDASVLLDDSFLNTHCFHVARDSVSKPGQVGLAFEPVLGRTVSDIRGVLWLNEETSQLRSLDVVFTNVPRGVADDRVGGNVEFMQLPSGAWIVQRWQVRTPKILREATVTIVVIGKYSGFERSYRLYARSGGRRFPLGTYRPRAEPDTITTQVPWNPEGLALEAERVGRGHERLHSRMIAPEPGTVLYLVFPEDLRPGGLLRPYD